MELGCFPYEPKQNRDDLCASLTILGDSLSQCDRVYVCGCRVHLRKEQGFVVLTQGWVISFMFVVPEEPQFTPAALKESLDNKAVQGQKKTMNRDELNMSCLKFDKESVVARFVNQKAKTTQMKGSHNLGNCEDFSGSCTDHN